MIHKFVEHNVALRLCGVNSKSLGVVEEPWGWDEAEAKGGCQPGGAVWCAALGRAVLGRVGFCFCPFSFTMLALPELPLTGVVTGGLGGMLLLR